MSEFEIEYSVGDSSEGAPSKDGSDDSSSEAGVVFEISPDDSSDSRWADDSSSTDTEISDQVSLISILAIPDKARRKRSLEKGQLPAMHRGKKSTSNSCII